MADPLSKQVLAKILTRYVAQASVHTTLDAILPPEIMGDARERYIENLRPEALNDLPKQMEALTEELDRRKLLTTFVQTLLRSRFMDIRLQGIFSGEVAVDDQGNLDEGHVQSLRSRVSPFVNSKTFGDFMVSVRHRVCAIWTKEPDAPSGDFSGTGFLIAPDLVMTAHHVVKRALERVPDPNNFADPKYREREGAVVKCVFDYWTTFYQNKLDKQQPSGITVVEAAAQWLVWYSPRHPQDGVSHTFPYPPDISKRLDCAVIRLAKPIGAEAFAMGGGRMRCWIKLPDAGPSVVKNDPIAILQHPGGGPQSMDKGTFSDSDGSQTRIWYTTEAAAGSSGSPCFDKEADIIGFHNAGRPTGYEGPTKDCNQGVRMDQVVAALPTDLITRSRNDKVDESPLWSLSDRSDQPIPVLGRTEFKAAVLKLFDPRAEKRMIVVDEAKDAEPVGRSGKSFSAGILKAIARDRPALVLEFSARELSKYTPEEFVGELCRRIGIDPTKHAPMPTKPDGDRQVTRWWSSELPDWFGQLLEDRAVPAVMAAQEQAVQSDAAPATGRELVIKELIWIVIDDIHKWPPVRGLRELLAGMAGVTDTQQVLRAGLKALRWLIIGHVPDFVRDRASAYEPDTVSPSRIGKKEWVDCLRAYFLSSGQPDRFNEVAAQALYDFSMGMLPDATNPEKRLSIIAAAIPTAIRSFPVGG